MANLVIKPASGSGNKVVFQNQAGNVDAITVEDSGNTTLAGASNNLGTVTAGSIAGGSITSATTFPAGHVIQVVMGTPFTGGEATASTSTSGVDTSVFATITPLRSTSDILVFGSISVGVTLGGAYGGSVWMCRSQAGGETDTRIIVGDGAGSRTRGTGGIYSDTNNYQHFIIPTLYLDSPTIPASPVAITYRYKMKSGWSNSPLLINYGGNDSDGQHATRVSSYITLMEVSG